MCSAASRWRLLAVATFTLSSVFCGLALSLPMLVVFRILQGLGGGCLQPTSRAMHRHLGGHDAAPAPSSPAPPGGDVLTRLAAGPLRFARD
jgi:predicted MFS family arabinose efflux permease